MDFELDDDQHALQQAVRDLVDNECPPELVRAVVEGRILLQLESDGHVPDLHVLGELHLELVAVVIGRAIRTGFHFVADQAVVAIPRDLIARHVGADAMDVDIVWPAFEIGRASCRERVL